MSVVGAGSWLKRRLAVRVRLASWYLGRGAASGAGEGDQEPYDLHFPLARLIAQSLRLLASLPESVGGAAGERRAIVLAEPSMTSTSGHHFEITMAVARAYRDQGFDVHILANRRFPPPDDAAHRASTAANLTPFPAFGATFYETFAGQSPAALSFVANAAGVAADLTLALAQIGVPRPALLVFPTSGIVEIAGATLLRPRFWLSRSQERQTHLLYYDARAPVLGPTSPYGPRVHQAIFRLLRGVLASGRVRLVTDSPTARAGLQAVGVPGAEEIALPIMVRPGARVPGAPIAIGFLGAARIDKGALLLPAIVEGLLARAPTTRILLQTNIGQRDLDFKAILAQLGAIEAEPGRFTLVDRALSSEAYAALFREVDILVLPYDPVIYATKTSGVCLEGLVGAKVMVGPGSGWVADRGREGGAYIGVDTRSAAAVVEGIEEAIGRFEELAARARESAPRFAERHAPEVFAAALAGGGADAPANRHRNSKQVPQ